MDLITTQMIILLLLTVKIYNDNDYVCGIPQYKLLDYLREAPK